MALGENTPKLGFGLMRLPMIGDEVDIEQTKKMVDLLRMCFRIHISYLETIYLMLQTVPLMTWAYLHFIALNI